VAAVFLTLTAGYIRQDAIVGHHECKGSQNAVEVWRLATDKRSRHVAAKRSSAADYSTDRRTRGTSIST